MVVYHLVSTQYLLIRPIQHDNLHLSFCLVLVFLTLPGKSKWHSVLALAGITLTLVSTGYRYIFSEELELLQCVPQTTLQIVVGIILLLVVILLIAMVVMKSKGAPPEKEEVKPDRKIEHKKEEPEPEPISPDEVRVEKEDD